MKTAGNYDIAVLIELFLDGECSPAERSALDAAIADDPALQSEIQQAIAVRKVFDSDNNSLNLPQGDKSTFMSKVAATPSGVTAGVSSVSASIGASAILGVSATGDLNRTASAEMSKAGAEGTGNLADTSANAASAAGSGAAPTFMQSVANVLKTFVYGAGLSGWAVSSALFVTMFVLSSVDMPRPDMVAVNSIEDSGAFQGSSLENHGAANHRDAAMVNAAASIDGAQDMASDATTAPGLHTEEFGATPAEVSSRVEYDLNGMHSSAHNGASSSQQHPSGSEQSGVTAIFNQGNAESTINSLDAQIPDVTTDELPREVNGAEQQAAAKPDENSVSLAQITAAPLFSAERGLTRSKLADANPPFSGILSFLQTPADEVKWSLRFSGGYLLGVTETMPQNVQPDFQVGLLYHTGDELALGLEGGAESILLVEINGAFFTDVDRISYLAGGLTYEPEHARFGQFRPYVQFMAGVSDYGLLLKSRLGLHRAVVGPIGAHMSLELGGLRGSWQDVGKVSFLTGIDYRF